MLMNFLCKVFTGFMEILAWITLALIVIGGISVGISFKNILMAVPVWIVGLFLLLLTFGSISVLIKVSKDVSELSNRQKEQTA